MKTLCLVFDPDLKAIVNGAAAADALQFVESKDQFFEDYETYVDGQFAAVICEVTTSELANEVGQVMRNQCPRTPVFACALDRSLFEPKLFKKNGYTDAFLFPLDRNEFLEQFNQAIAMAGDTKRVLKRVLLPDLQPDTKPAFSTFVHLPLNNKYIQYSAKDETFSAKKAAKLKEKHVGALFIDQKEADSFFEYVAAQMKVGDNTLSATERQDKLKSSVREIFSEVFDNKTDDTFESGRQLLDSCRKIVSAYVLNGTDKGDLHGRLLRNINGAGLEYTHSADVSTIAALFGMAIGSTQVESLAIAGFLHDLSLAGFPVEHAATLESQWPDAVKKTFVDHPLQSVNLLKTKKVIISADAEKMILQHHERFDGKGFPRGLSGDRVDQGAQILSMADQFQYLTIARLGVARLQATEAIDAIEANHSIDPALTRSIRKLLAA